MNNQNLFEPFEFVKDVRYKTVNVTRKGTMQIASRYDIFTAKCKVEDIDNACVEIAKLSGLKSSEVVLRDTFLSGTPGEAVMIVRVFPDIHSAERFAFRNYGKTRCYRGLVKSKLN